MKFHFLDWYNERSKTFQDRLPGFAVVAGGCVEGGLVVAVWRGREKEHKGKSSLMIKVSFYSLYSDKKEVPVPPDSCPLRKNQSNCWSAFVIDMSREWTKLQRKPTLISVTKALLRLPFSFHIFLFLICRCYGWQEMYFLNSACACHDINSCDEPNLNKFSWWNHCQVWFWARIWISFRAFQGTSSDISQVPMQYFDELRDIFLS